MNMNLSMFLSVVDGNEIIKVTDYNNETILYEGKKVDCPFFDANVFGVWTCSNSNSNCKIIIAVK